MPNVLETTDLPRKERGKGPDEFEIFVFSPSEAGTVLERFNPQYTPPTSTFENPPPGTSAPGGTVGPYLELEYLWRMGWYCKHYPDKALPEKHHLFVAVDKKENTVVGFAHVDYVNLHNHGWTHTLAFIYVEPTFRREGLATRIVNRVFQTFDKVYLSGAVTEEGDKFSNFIKGSYPDKSI